MSLIRKERKVERTIPVVSSPDMPRVQHEQVVWERHRIRVACFEGERALDDVLEADKRKLREPVDLAGVTHGGDQV